MNLVVFGDNSKYLRKLKVFGFLFLLPYFYSILSNRSDDSISSKMSCMFYNISVYSSHKTKFFDVHGVNPPINIFIQIFPLDKKHDMPPFSIFSGAQFLDLLISFIKLSKTSDFSKYVSHVMVS